MANRLQILDLNCLVSQKGLKSLNRKNERNIICNLLPFLNTNWDRVLFFVRLRDVGLNPNLDPGQRLLRGCLLTGVWRSAGCAHAQTQETEDQVLPGRS